MKWQEVRERFPNQFVRVSILNFHQDGDLKIVDDVAINKTLTNEEANQEFFKSAPDEIIYHTSNEELIIHIRKDPLLRVGQIREN
ncbi:hypothetical protein PU629_11325 [Pullulanibacillus sp. KACC 23026]|uniref:hypothetical protein n=1 Tax=Pullulanibacillus sp. KACC 23026 TaxID=3028315 RepID=UPI0023B1FEF0|nr:hypothetical protein [Pullulanibacillus sp. KACC 23026]WEG10777.1 hypothetical protein PU629_11325 [Pullulanibacillus sp. KACC 23026]